MIRLVEGDLIDKHWSGVMSHIRPAIEHACNETNEELIYDKVKYGNAKILAIFDDASHNLIGSVIVEPIVFPTGKKVLNAILGGGICVDKWAVELFDTMCEIANHIDCEELYGVGRLGWERYLKPLGFKKVHSVMSYKLEK